MKAYVDEDEDEDEGLPSFLPHIFRSRDGDSDADEDFRLKYKFEIVTVNKFKKKTEFLARFFENTIN